MKMDLIYPALIRDYRDGGAFQWVREVLQNALEAFATEVDFKVLPLTIEGREQKVLKRYVADNGIGMSKEELASYFNKYATGGKRIGKTDENFGIGAKASLLPWNRLGLVIVSKVKDHAAHAVWIDFGEDELGVKDFGARIHDETGEEAFLAGYHEELGVDLSELVKGEHGTTFLLLGDVATQSTALTCDPASDERHTDISNFIDRRYYELRNIGDEFVKVFVQAPKDEYPDLSVIDSRHTGNTKKGWFIRWPKGFLYFESRLNQLANEVETDDGITIRYSAAEEPIATHGPNPALLGGAVSVLWRGERYHIRRDNGTRRIWGLVGKHAQHCAITILGPSESDGGDWWLEPSAGRNTLRFGGSRKGSEIPFADYALWFSINMPPELRDFIDAGLPQVDDCDDARATRIAELFGERFGAVRFKVDDDGEALVTPIYAVPDRTSDEPIIEPNPDPTPGTKEGVDDGPTPAKPKKKKGELPKSKWLTMLQAEELGMEHEFGRGRLACYQTGTGGPLGTVFIRKDDPVIEAQINHWHERTIGSSREAVRDAVLSVYSLHIRTAIAHILGTFLRPPKRGGLAKADVYDKYLSSEALTVTAMGLWLADRRIMDQLVAIGVRVQKELGEKVEAAE
jgi:hypothetical protein